ncbi:glycerol-3-phosphate acyltransferase 2, mitochondrial [Thalassophryne amazonica]|uniref:glycerol-3-phosphate acyltransferase 2, mitochondrial n=1 Tax=Thalassophryne amazonica TaxID=390379 RepID=UPI001470E7A6|nr:glycerol-3-phosphate acyltransferase 2, mitochondrial [Thalassophryne amazonica]
MMPEKNDSQNKKMAFPPEQQKRLGLKKMLKKVPPCLGKFRPSVGQCCHQCTPDSLRKKLGHNSACVGFQNLLRVSETHTRYRGWLVRRICCVLFVSGRKVYASPAGKRLERVCQSNRVKEALTAVQKAPEGGDGQGQLNLLSPFHQLINTCISPGLVRFMGWVMLKIFSSILGSIQVNLSHLSALHSASKEVQGSLLVYVHVRQSIMDCALIPLVLFCHNLRVPYTFCPFQISSSLLRSVLRKVGVVLLPRSALTEEDAEMDSIYSTVMASLVQELLHEGQAISVGVLSSSGQGGQWLAHLRQLIKEGSLTDISLVPVGISYDCVPKSNIQADLSSLLLWMWSRLWKKSEGTVRIHFAKPFSLKETCETGRCRVDGWLPLQDLLLPVILNKRTASVYGQRMMSWLLPSQSVGELRKQPQAERDLSIGIILHLIFSATSCMAVMSTSLVSSLLLYRHRKGVFMSALCQDVNWLTEELLFRNKDVGFGGSLAEVIHYSLSLLAPHIIVAAVPSRKDPVVIPRPSLVATLHLTLNAQIVTHTFIMEAVGACAVSAMLCEVAGSGVSSSVRSDGVDGDKVRGDMEFDVVFCQSELTERALRLCHLLPPGFMPPCHSSLSFALDAVDSLVRCGILIMEEIPRAVPMCDFWKKEGVLSWTTTDDPYQSDSDCEDRKPHAIQGMLSQPSQCPEMLFFLCSMLAGYLSALCRTTACLDLLHTPLPKAEFLTKVHSYLCDTASKNKQQYESCSEETAHSAVRTLIDLGVLLEERQSGGIFLGVSPLFQLSENRQKLHRFISQYLYN